MQRQIERRVRLGATVLVAAALCTSCGAGQGRDAPTADATVEPASAVPETLEATQEPTPVPVEGLPDEPFGWVWAARQPDGSTYEVTFTRYPPQRAEAFVPPHPGFDRSTGCVEDTERDLLIPFDVVFENTTTSFDVEGSWVMAFESSQQSLSVMNPDGSCIDPSDELLGISFGTEFVAAEGGSSTAVGMVVVHGYFTPTRPEGSGELPELIAKMPAHIGGNDDNYAFQGDRTSVERIQINSASIQFPLLSD